MHLKNIVVRGLQGSIIGVFIIQLIGLIMMLSSNTSTLHSSEFLIKQNIAGFILGFTFGALNILFTLDRLGLINATIFHFLGVGIVFAFCSSFAQWDINILLTVSILLTSYGLIWLACYLHWKREVFNVNEKLKKLS
jgi:ABC-type Mn2+/Zn2+ transport system permease subunit